MKYPAYPKYRSSGVEWLGYVPEHWSAVETRFAYSVQLGKMLQPEPGSAEDTLVPYLKALHVQWETVQVEDLPTMWASKRDARNYVLSDGDLLVCEGGEVGRSGILRSSPPNAIMQNALHRVRPKNGNDLRFLMYTMRTASAHGWFDILCNRSTIAHFTGDKFGALKIGLPSPAEQQAIADFLDAQTGRIDTLVGKKRELVEKLNEKRTALISRTVTRGLPPDAARAAGLDPSPPLRPSGIEWLGNIPECWEVMRLGYVVGKVGSGKTPKGGAETYQEEGVMLLRSQNVHDNGLRLDDVAFIDEAMDDQMAVSRVQAGDVLLNITGASLGRCTHVPDGFPPANVNQHVCIIRPERLKMHPRFLQHVISSLYIQSQIFSYENGSSREGLNFQQIRNLLVAVPRALDEQSAVADYLDCETSTIDRMVEKVEAAIERLQEYRTALITAAVTGKIDVREVAV